MTHSFHRIINKFFIRIFLTVMIIVKKSDKMRCIYELFHKFNICLRMTL